MKGITLCADCAYYNMKKHKCTRGCKIDPDVSKGENPSFYVDCPLPDVEPLQKWIPCSERMPETDTPVICYMRIGQILVMELSDDDGWYCGITRYNPRAVTHWMYLPEPPESEVQHD